MKNEQVCHLILKSSPTTPATPLALFSPDVEVTSLREAGGETLVISPLNMSLVTNLTSGMSQYKIYHSLVNVNYEIMTTSSLHNLI